MVFLLPLYRLGARGKYCSFQLQLLQVQFTGKLNVILFKQYERQFICLSFIMLNEGVEQGLDKLCRNLKLNVTSQHSSRIRTTRLPTVSVVSHVPYIFFGGGGWVPTLGMPPPEATYSLWFSGWPVATGYQISAWAPWSWEVGAQLGYQEFQKETNFDSDSEDENEIFHTIAKY